MISLKRIWAFPLLYFFVYLYHLVVTKYQGDDIIFSKVSNDMTITQWLYTRYMEWSSRIFSDAMVYFILGERVWLWRIINPLLLIFLAIAIVRIWKRNFSFLEVLVALMLIGFFAQNVLSSGIFWITGSINYLWPIAFGMLAMIPYADKVFRDESESLNNNFLFSLFLIIGFLASIGNEQVSLCISCFAILSHFALYWRHQKQNKKLIIMTICMVIGTSLMLLAPGNKERWIQEVAYWFPEFEDLSLKDHLYLGTVWAFEKVFYDMKYLVMLLSVITLIPYFQSKQFRNNRILKVFAIFFMLIVLVNISEIGKELLYNFKAIKSFDFSANLLAIFTGNASFVSAVFPYAFWTAFSLMLGYLTIKNSQYKLFILISLLAFTATLMVMFFSPTIYGSGNRVLTVGSTILVLLITGKILENNLIQSWFYVFLLACFPIINLSQMLYKWLQNGFNPFL
ncbi:DUF6056 family protein [Neobacillus niacini]|uniref:DUF6056 family protein n=1 Tax=Neobacillus niacini TaxID=86668 RepID=UPI0021CB039F|nr:DUF6056 family protein [Neobacillus niacini]MCM3763508.1 DUF6056 family protein [Neobacillus niacini]